MLTIFGEVPTAATSATSHPNGRDEHLLDVDLVSLPACSTSVPGLDLYVANDMTVNQFWSGENTAGDFRMTDLGAIRGLGLSGRSLSQASMGMAVGDPDRDGDIDFFLTHFAGDHNTFYEQAAPGLWVDRTVQRGLAEPSMDLLGFGHRMDRLGQQRSR